MLFARKFQTQLQFTKGVFLHRSHGHELKMAPIIFERNNDVEHKKNNSKEKLIMNLSTVFLEIQQFVSNTLQVLFEKNSSSSPVEIGRRKNID